MATADQYETQIDALVAAGGVLIGYGSTGDRGSAIIATSERSHRVTLFHPNSGVVGDIGAYSDLAGALGLVRRGSDFGSSAVVLQDTPYFQYLFARFRKTAG